ncbi:MAG: SDR family NAD(P)-dependent oxidoreductase [bacterium]|nr:SDR family NAD(P)-dependent oxidoreductase [bacterium]
MDHKLVKTLLLGVAAGAAVTLLKRPNRFNLDGKRVVVTGGARGLGLVLARELVSRGARVAICSRHEDELARAVADLQSRGGEVIAFRTDLTEREHADSFIDECSIRYGGVDVLINNAGVIQVGPLEEQTEKDFRDAMNVHFWAPYHTMQAVVPLMKKNGGGRIANIVSIGGKVAVPHLAPYCASKFALSGLSKAFANELAKDSIKVTTVYPGLMRTGSHVNALFKGQNEKEFALFSVMDATPATSISAERAAAQIIEAIELGKSELTISIQAKAVALLSAIAPELTATLMQRSTLFLPGEGGIGERLATGLESRTDLIPDIVTSAIDNAAEQNNELKPGESLV